MAAVLRHERQNGAVKSSSIEVFQVAGGKRVVALERGGPQGDALNFSADGAALLCVYKTNADGVVHFEMRNFQNEVQWERANEGNV
jgi:hypothetical protein